MAVKKEKKAVATEKKAATAKKEAAPKKAAAKLVEIDLSAQNVGFKAGDVYQKLATEGKPLSVGEIEKRLKISREEILLAIGWLLREGKIKDEGGRVVLA